MEPALDHSWINEVLKKYGIACSGHMSIQVSLYLKLLEKWNNKINLTGLRTPREMLVELFAESFFVIISITSLNTTTGCSNISKT